MGADGHVALHEHLPRSISGKGDIFLYLATERGADVDESWAILPALRHTIPEHSQVLAHSLPHGGIVRRGWAEGVPLRFPAIFPDMRRYAITEVGVAWHLLDAEDILQPEAELIYYAVCAVQHRNADDVIVVRVA